MTIKINDTRIVSSVTTYKLTTEIHINIPYEQVPKGWESFYDEEYQSLVLDCDIHITIDHTEVPSYITIEFDSGDIYNLLCRYISPDELEDLVLQAFENIE